MRSFLRMSLGMGLAICMNTQVSCSNDQTPPGGTGGKSGSGGGPATGGSPSTGGTHEAGGASETGATSAAGGTSSAGATSAAGGSGSGGTTKGTGGAGTGGSQSGGSGGPASGGAASGGSGAGGKSTGGASGSTTASGGSVGGAGSGGAKTGGTTGPSDAGRDTAGGGGTTGGSGGAAGGASGGTSGDGGSSAGGSTSTFVENSGASCNATSAPLLSAQLKKLPDPFAMHDGTRISSKSQWECRRNEILQDIYKYEIGPKPDPSQTTVAATYSGGNLSVKVTSSSGSLTIKSAVTGSGTCVVIGTDMNLGFVTGCTTLVFSTTDVIPYNGGSGSQNKSDPFYTVFPSLWGKIGNYTAWSWGVSRMIDGLDQVKDQLNIDMTKIATHGCSYAGKMSLFAGALDERVALVVVEESGGGGIDSWRASQDFTTRTGTSVEKIDNTNYAWFMSSMKSLDHYKLPHDHHELIAAIAPRATIILGNDDYDWLGDESGYKSTIAAIEVFKALGVADHIGYDFTSGHGHCAAPTTQKNSINAFADHFLKDKTSTSTAIAIKPPKSGFDLTVDYDWTAPTLQ